MSFLSTGFDDIVDDAMAIFVALKSPEVDVIGLTTIYGNVYTTLATRNALHLVSFLHLFHRDLKIEMKSVTVLDDLIIVSL